MVNSSAQIVHRDVLIKEFINALDVLEHAFRGRPVSIVISNWEGDNLVYCGSAFAYATNLAVREACRRSPLGNPATRLNAFMQWINLRQVVINKYRRSHPGFDVEQAPEFNSLHLFESLNIDGQSPTVLSALRRGRVGRWPLCSYSAYDSLGKGTLKKDVSNIFKICAHLVIGELGIDRNLSSNIRAMRYSDYRSALNVGGQNIKAVFFWKAFEGQGGKDAGFGLFSDQGADLDYKQIPANLLPR